MLSRRQLLLATPALAQPAPRFSRRFFFLSGTEKLRFTDMAFGSDKFGWATGVVLKSQQRNGTLYSTSDGGATWRPSPLSFLPISLFNLDDSALWAVSDKGEIWFSAEAGRDWRKLSRQKNAQRVHFLDNKVGYLVGPEKTLMRTGDGGRSWRHEPIGAQVTGNADAFVYRTVNFWNGKIGMVTGGVDPEREYTLRRRRRFLDIPEWMNPDEVGLRFSEPRVMVSLETSDAGQTWSKQEVSGFGYVHRVIIGADGQGFILVKFSRYFTYGGELYTIFAKGGKTGSRLLREKDLEFQDVAYIPGDGVYVAATERQGSLPVPTKVRILHSKDLATWTNIAVDYRAVAMRIFLATTPGGNVIACLDHGTILSLR